MSIEIKNFVCFDQLETECFLIFTSWCFMGSIDSKYAGVLSDFKKSTHNINIQFIYNSFGHMWQCKQIICVKCSIL